MYFFFIVLELLIGLEPTTYWLQINCSTNWATVALISIHIISKCYTPSITLRERFVKRVEKNLVESNEYCIYSVFCIFYFLYIRNSVYTLMSYIRPHVCTILALRESLAHFLHTPCGLRENFASVSSFSHTKCIKKRLF